MSYIRYLREQICTDLEEKMVFVGGPRQVGKTTMSKAILPILDGHYLNWDNTKDREYILTQQLPDAPFWIFDEIHKYQAWRNYLKGLYDTYAHSKKILVTGSARLDLYRYGGDSLQGRFHYLRLHPLSVSELNIDSQEGLESLMRLGGFPEPYFKGQESYTKRWSRAYRQRLIEEDVTQLENINMLDKLELLMIRLPKLVGSPLSLNALREDLQVSHKTVSNWIDIYEKLYAIFRLPPFGSPLIRAVKKEQKHYHFDWTLVQEPGLRFENLIACHLLKWVHYEQDVLGRDLRLGYFRDTDGREVDFIISENESPIMAIECKYSLTNPSKTLHYFKKKFPNCDCYQLHFQKEKNFISKEGIFQHHALSFLKKLK